MIPFLSHSFGPPLSTVGTCLRILLVALGPVYVKAGQLLSVRHDLLPEAITDELEKLQDHVPTVPWKKIERIVVRSLGPKFKQVRDLETRPVASGSLCQVYRVTLDRGRDGALKVLRPGAEAAVERAFRHHARILHLLPPRLGPFIPQQILQAVEVGLRAHLDLRKEARNAILFHRNFQHNDLVRFPAPFPGLISREALIMEFFEGVKLSRYTEVGADPSHLASLGLSSIYQMIFHDGFVHGDLHPANIFVLEGGKSIGYIDLGLACRIPKREISLLVTLLCGLAHKNRAKVAYATFRLAGGRKKTPPRLFEQKMEAILERIYDKPMSALPIGSFLRDTTLALHCHGLSFPEHLSLALASLLAIEGAAKKLFPAAQPFEHARQFLSAAATA